MADIVLVQPTVCFSDSVRSRPSLPLGLLHVGGAFDGTFRVTLVDQRTDPQWRDSLLNELKKRPLFVGMTVKTGNQVTHALTISRFVREHSSVPVVWGGMLGSFYPEIAASHEDVDVVVRGDGDITIRELAEAYLEGKGLAGIKGITYTDESGHIIHNSDRPLKNLDCYPSPNLNLVDVKSYLQDYLGYASLPLQSSRGCTRKCSFCYNQAVNRGRWRAMAPERVIEQIELCLRHAPIENIFFVDDNFFIDLDRAKRFAELLIAKKTGITWQPHGTDIVSVLKMSDGYLRMLIRSGLTGFKFGVESGSPRIRKMIHKAPAVNDIIRLNRRLRSFGLMVDYNFMAGFPGETIADITQTVSLMRRLLADNPKARTYGLNLFTPYPNTPVYDSACTNGFVPYSSLEGLSAHTFDSGVTGQSKPGHLSEEVFAYIRDLSFLTPFLDEKSRDFDVCVGVRFLYDAYKHIARFRLRHGVYSFMIERDLSLLLRRLI